MKLSPQEGVSASYAVFTGTVTKIEKNEETKFGGLTVRLRVSKIWKGEVGEEVKVHTAASGAACGYSFAEGETYLVYASRDEADPLRVSLCSRTALEKSADEDLKFLGKPTTQFAEAPQQKQDKRDAADSSDRCSASPGSRAGTGSGWAILLIVGFIIATRRFVRLA
jgi:hypothetical protein